MRIKQLKLYSNQLEKEKQFYQNILGVEEAQLNVINKQLF